jgi:hypothetical protein
MYFVVMPRVNLIVILMTYVLYLYSINCLTIICLPSMLLFILWRDTITELWTSVHSFTLLLPFYFYSLYLHSCKLLPFTTRYALMVAIGPGFFGPSRGTRKQPDTKPGPSRTVSGPTRHEARNGLGFF